MTGLLPPSKPSEKYVTYPSQHQDVEGNGPPVGDLTPWCVLRTDDNGVSNVFAKDLDRIGAEKLADCMNELGHKQFYDAVLMDTAILQRSSYGQNENITVLNINEQPDGRHTIIFQQNGQHYSQANAGLCIQGTKTSDSEVTYFEVFFEVSHGGVNQAKPLDDR